MDNYFLTINEIFCLIILVIALILPFNILDKNNRLTFAHPLIFYSLLMIFFTVLCPFVQVLLNETTHKLYDFRDQYILGWQGAILSVISVLIGYSLKTGVKKHSTNYCDLNYESLWSIGLYLNIIGFFTFMIVMGFDISALIPFYNQSSAIDFLSYQGGFKNYLFNGQEFLVAGNLLMFASSYTTQRNFPFTILSILITSSLFLNSGFRFRIFFLFASILFFILIKEKKLRPSLAVNLGSLAGIILVLILTYLGRFRIYGSGLDFNADYVSNYNFFYGIFLQGEASIFSTTSGVMNIIPEIIPFQNFYPLIKTLLHPFPQFLFDKGSGDYVHLILDAVFGFRKIYFGAAYLNYGEYYIMFGWFGIFIFNFILGFLFKRLWSWIKLHKEEPLALMLYVLNVSFIFMIISRGYLPQQFHLYMFTIFPLNAIYYFNLKKKLIIH